MPHSILERYDVEDPAPHGGAVSHGLLWTGLLAAPAAWSLQLLLNYGFASHACFPREFLHDQTIPGWGWLWSALLVINILALLISLAATFISYRIWHRVKEEAKGTHGNLIEAGEGRTRFLAVWGIWSGVWFLIAILFDTIAVFGVPVCGS